MPRVKGGATTRNRRKRVLKLAKGYRGAKHRLFKTAKDQVMKSRTYAFRDRVTTKVISERFGSLELMLLLESMILVTVN